jgi:hypothetical protein
MNSSITGWLGVIAATLMVGAGCNAGPAGGEATMTGTLLGKSFTPVDAVSATNTTGGTTTTTIVFTDFAGACDMLQGDVIGGSSDILSFTFTGSSPLGTGTFSVTAPTRGTTAEGHFAEFTVCGSTAAESTSAGTITVTGVDSSGITGTFDLTFESDHVTGTFTAPTCAARKTVVGPLCGA